MLMNSNFWSALRHTLAAIVLLAGMGGAAANGQEIDGLQAAEETSSTVTLNWNSYQPSGENIAGYNIYRRAPGGTFRDPVDYVGVRDRENGTTFTDSRLRSGETYEYQIRGRTLSGEEMGRSRTISTTTEESSDGEYSYANLKVAVVIYKNANHRNGGNYQTPDRRVEDVKFYLEKARDFYWRNSNMKLNLELSYYPIEEYKDFGDAGSFESIRITADHLEENFGVVSTQYDFIFRIAPSIGGFFSFGVKDLRFSQGPGRRTGFAHLQWPMDRIRGYTKYPGEFDEQVSKETNQLIWLFIHEAQHTIDAIYKFNGKEEMGHGDHPEAYTNSNPDYRQLPDTLRFGKRFDFQATMLRTFDPDDFASFEDLTGDWGDTYVAKDADEDGFPDQNARLPFDENRFGSSMEATDTDDDGATDKEEATDGLYPYSAGDPEDPDTDGDGRPDGNDPYMRYDVASTIPRAGGLRPTIDGRVGEWEEKGKISQGVSYKTPDVGAFDPTVHGAHVEDSLYVALDIPAHAAPTLNFDLDGDGRWFGTGNTEIRFDVQNQGLAQIRTFDASTEARQFEQQVLNPDRDVRSPDGVWDTNPKYQNEFERVYQPSDIRFDVRRTDGRIGIEMAIPEREERGISFGTGSKIGLRIGYSNVQKNGGNATTFDKWSYVYYTLGESQAAPLEAAEKTKLLENIPNPFQSSTTIRYQTEETGQVEIVVYDILGRRVRTLVDREVQAGKDLQVRWSGNSVGSGMYFVRLRTESGQKDVRKVVRMQ
ncbi:T9SS type A sorting domain-containing protein [Salinibacter ruber]|uniref:Fibronectin type-III domain-containing protein n=1 Tax=Salinibacter ruber TaxID=146919 RepID=A0A9X2Z5H3_9BACT|nr:T9SS type A sorting domain-containing protein [Salinibacter ruber]MCS3952833.1 hypothetical protein [Salinibacter ruber]MCS3956370.1 hypothetical protein [Salinibacter ruber]